MPQARKRTPSCPPPTLSPDAVSSAGFRDPRSPDTRTHVSAQTLLICMHPQVEKHSVRAPQPVTWGRWLLGGRGQPAPEGRPPPTRLTGDLTCGGTRPRGVGCRALPAHTGCLGPQDSPPRLSLPPAAPGRLIVPHSTPPVWADGRPAPGCLIALMGAARAASVTSACDGGWHPRLPAPPDRCPRQWSPQLQEAGHPLTPFHPRRHQRTRGPRIFPGVQTAAKSQKLDLDPRVSDPQDLWHEDPAPVPEHGGGRPAGAGCRGPSLCLEPGRGPGPPALLQLPEALALLWADCLLLDPGPGPGSGWWAAQQDLLASWGTAAWAARLPRGAEGLPWMRARPPSSGCQPARLLEVAESWDTGVAAPQGRVTRLEKALGEGRAGGHRARARRAARVTARWVLFGVLLVVSSPRGWGLG